LEAADTRACVESSTISYIIGATDIGNCESYPGWLNELGSWIT
jgi:hypothetical protein